MSCMATMKAVTPTEHKILKEDFWNKNERLGRPQSPHLTIYKLPVNIFDEFVHREFQTASYLLFTTITNFVISRQKIEIYSFNYSCCLKELKFSHNEVNYSAI